MARDPAGRAAAELQGGSGTLGGRAIRTARDQVLVSREMKGEGFDKSDKGRW